MARRWPHIGILLGAVAIAAAYLPMLNAPFDFVDDGNLVYPAHCDSTAHRMDVVWQKVVANYDHLGPFRPTLWVHWEIAADAFHGSPIAWRAARLIWNGLAVAMLLVLLRELGISFRAGMMSAGLAMWNPFRNEIWTSLTLAEGVAMPYAIFSLVAALRASRSQRSLVWDIAGIAAVIVALGCKNTFMVLIPVQILFRISTAGDTYREGLRRVGWRIPLLTSTLILPAAHMVYFKLHWHPGQYETVTPTFAFLIQYLKALQGAMSLDFLGVGVLLAAIALPQHVANPGRVIGPAAALLILGGTMLYLPIGAIAGRYSMPAVWGLDLLFAVLVQQLLMAPSSLVKRFAILALVVGLAITLTACIGKQAKVSARSQMLWEIAHTIEAESRSPVVIGWVSTTGLNIEEGIHMQWHLQNRDNVTTTTVLLDAHGVPQSRVEIENATKTPTMLVTESDRLPARFINEADRWTPQVIRVSYWGGRKVWSATLWRRLPG
jgi:hypothetical protein